MTAKSTLSAIQKNTADTAAAVAVAALQSRAIPIGILSGVIPRARACRAWNMRCADKADAFQVIERSEIGNEALPNRISNIHEDDWNRRGLLHDGSECRRRGGHDHVWF
jgi:hypothetical protein